MAQDCNQRKLGTTFAATITPSRTGFRATETAISGIGLQSMAPGPHYVQLNSATRQTGLACPSRSPVFWGYTRMRHGRRDSCGVSIGWFWGWWDTPWSRSRGLRDRSTARALSGYAD